jgi:hypothetical protein
MMVQLDESQTELHLRTYLAAPPVDLVDADLARVPEAIRVQMTGQGGMVADLPALWFDPDDLRDPWRLAPEDQGREAERAAQVAEAEQGPPGVGYRAANESPTSSAPEPFDIDPTERDRSTRAHAVTQNALADAVRALGREPLSPQGEPNYDLAWEELDGSVIVAEVKSITARNEERQLRLGLGQLLRYCDLVTAGGRSARGVLVTSSEPSDERWVSLCNQVGVGLIWPPGLDDALDSWLASSGE